MATMGKGGTSVAVVLKMATRGKGGAVVPKMATIGYGGAAIDLVVALLSYWWEIQMCCN